MDTLKRLEAARRNWKKSHTEEHRIALQEAREEHKKETNACLPILSEYNIL